MLTFDAHIDVPWQFTKQGPYNLWERGKGVVDFPRMAQGGLASACFALYLPDSMQDRLGPQDSLRSIYEQITHIQSQSQCRIVGSPLEASIALTQANVPIWFGLEGGRLLNNDPTHLRRLRDRQVRYLTLCHNKNTAWCNSATDTPIHAKGLLKSLAGPIIDMCNRLNILVDVSHAHDSAIGEAWALSERPIIATHSAARSLVNTPRNLPNDLAKMIMKSGGIIGVPFAARFLGKYSPAEHIDHFAQLSGTSETVGIGSDLDGAEMCPECPDATRWYDAFAEGLTLLDWSDDMIADVAGNNFMRMFAL